MARANRSLNSPTVHQQQQSFRKPLKHALYSGMIVLMVGEEVLVISCQFRNTWCNIMIHAREIRRQASDVM